MNKPSDKRSFMLAISIPLVIILPFCFIKPMRDCVKQVFFMFQLMDVNLIKGYILSFGIWAPIVSFLLMIFQSVIAPLPAFLITFANAAIFGWKYGALLSWTSAMAGAGLCFFIAKCYGRNTVEKLTSKTCLQNVDTFFDNYGKYAILVARLLPFVSFDIVSYGAGLTGMSIIGFFVATGIGQLPATLAYSYAGGMLTGGVRNFMLGLSAIFALTAVLAIYKKTRKRAEA